MILTTALYVLGLGTYHHQCIIDYKRTANRLPTRFSNLLKGFGPFLFAPISELRGRQVSYTTSMVGFTLINLGCAFAPK